MRLLGQSRKKGKAKNHTFNYDFLIISTGCKVVPEENDGLVDAWGKNAFSFYPLRRLNSFARD